MRVLVAGSEGSLMQAVIPRLVSAGHVVVGVDNFFRYGPVTRERCYEFFEGDLSDPAFVRKVINEGIDGVIQGAARIFGVAGFHAYPADILGFDLALHHNLLRRSIEVPSVKRVVYISSSMVYERSDEIPSLEEHVDTMPVPRTDYGLSKLAGERLSRAFQKQYGLEFTIWRPFNIITPFERSEQNPGYAHVFADFIDRIILERQSPLSIIGDGRQVRCFTWIGDVADAIAEFSFDTRATNEVFNLGNPEPIEMRSLAEQIFQTGQQKGVIPTDAILRFCHLAPFEDDVRMRVPSCAKAKREFGWKPKVKLQEAISRCVDQALQELSVSLASYNG